MTGERKVDRLKPRTARKKMRKGRGPRITSQLKAGIASTTPAKQFHSAPNWSVAHPAGGEAKNVEVVRERKTSLAPREVRPLPPTNPQGQLVSCTFHRALRRKLITPFFNSRPNVRPLGKHSPDTVSGCGSVHSSSSSGRDDSFLGTASSARRGRALERDRLGLLVLIVRVAGGLEAGSLDAGLDPLERGLLLDHEEAEDEVEEDCGATREWLVELAAGGRRSEPSQRTKDEREDERDLGA